MKRISEEFETKPSSSNDNGKAAPKNSNEYNAKSITLTIFQ
ncbi:hypothetical protein [Methanobrevibacter sp.]|nr:hypothetical protein [Methanobrevibacter sp.]MDO5860518.1 hypothetical protein [Methanobrevibacter sp.]